MTEPSDEIIASEEQAVRVKAQLAGAGAPKRWVAALCSTVDAAASFANAPPPLGAGEAVFSVRDDGKVDVFLFL
jgi:hypothetical protein